MLLTLVKRLIARLYVYLHGTHFYKTDHVPKSPSYKRLEVKTINNHTVTFYFYEEVFTNVRYRFGKFSLQEIKVFLLQAAFDDAMSETVTKYNNLKMFVDVDEFTKTTEHIIEDLMLDAYMEFILVAEDSEKK